MPLSCQQIVKLAGQMAKVPSFTAQAGQLLNMILSDLCQTYDFALARGIFAFNFNARAFSLVQGTGDDFSSDFSPDFGPLPYAVPSNGGPFKLPADYLRSKRDDVFYTIDGDPHVMINIDNSEFDALIQQTGTQSYPEYYTVVLQPGGVPPAMYVWPPPSGGYPVTVRYQRQMPDYQTPETSPQAPWFPNQDYLITRLAGELMRLSGDDRMDRFLGLGPTGAQGILKRYLNLKDDDEDRVKLVTLDRRRFSPKWNSLPSTKAIGFP